MSYRGGSLDLGWVAGFLLLALAGLARSATAVPETPESEATAELRADLLPYAPVAVALILVRQYLTLRENVRLNRELVRREAMLRHQAFHDALTGVANRALFLDRLEHAFAVHRRDRRPVALLFLDLDDFKIVNDTLGHAAGDQLLVEVAVRLRRALRTADTVARLGGDEFAVLLDPADDVQAAIARALDALRAPVLLAGTPVSVRASAGGLRAGPGGPARPGGRTARARRHRDVRGEALGQGPGGRLHARAPLQAGPREAPVPDLFGTGGVLTP